MLKPARAEVVGPDAHPMVRVWDILIRLFHWSLVTSFVIAWLTRHGSEDFHHLAGYAAAALVGLRVIWGVVGTHYARFRQFTRGPTTVLRYLGDIVAGREARYIGHNPAGGAMILALLVAMTGTALTGWMMTTDQFWGVEWVAKTHERIADGLLILVLLHISGVVLASVRHRENLVRAMVTGRKRAADAGDVP
ncbi:MAG TPA: cytochrome b/b6 domain-containing protein [Marmoricola sp.]|nr:cytochrome b/b6 domain-containing protein [Marmoricola sp.]